MGKGFLGYFDPYDIACVAACLALNTFNAPMVKFTQNASGGYSYNKWCVFFFAEIIKIVVSGGWCVHAYFTDPVTRQKMQVDKRDMWQYSIPAIVYFFQNNLSFIALQHMSNSAFQLLLNLRIVAVALLSVAILGKPMNRVEWAGVVLLMNGAVQFELSGMGRGDCTAAGGRAHAGMAVDFVGLVVMGVIIFFASVGNIVTQQVMQRKMDQPLPLQNSLLYAWGIAFNGLNWWTSTTGRYDGGVPQPWFGDVGRVQVAAMMFYAVYGLSISVVLKRLGAVARTLISCAAIVCTATLDWAVFHVRATMLQGTCFLTIFAAILIYSTLAGDYVPGRAKAAQQQAAAQAAAKAVTPDAEQRGGST